MISKHPFNLKIQYLFGSIPLRHLLPLTDMCQKISVSQFCAVLWETYLRCVF